MRLHSAARSDRSAKPRRQRDGMAAYNERGAAPGERGTLGRSFADYERCKPTTAPYHAQLDALDRLGLLRAGLDDWEARGCVGPMPTPDQFGLRLGSLSSSEVHWRRAT